MSQSLLILVLRPLRLREQEALALNNAPLAVHTIPDTFCAAKRKPYQIGLLLTHKSCKLWGREYYDGSKLSRADLESGASHIG